MSLQTSVPWRVMAGACTLSRTAPAGLACRGRLACVPSRAVCREGQPWWRSSRPMFFSDGLLCADSSDPKTNPT